MCVRDLDLTSSPQHTPMPQSVYKWSHLRLLDVSRLAHQTRSNVFLTHTHSQWLCKATCFFSFLKRFLVVVSGNHQRLLNPNNRIVIKLNVSYSHLLQQHLSHFYYYYSFKEVLMNVYNFINEWHLQTPVQLVHTQFIGPTLWSV